MNKGSKRYSTYRSPPPVFGKRLQPARKAWKSFTTALQSKLHKLNLPRAMVTLKNAATRGLEAAIRSLLPLKNYLMLNSNKRGRSSSSTFSRTVHNHFRHYNSRQHFTTYGQIYKDDLYEEKKVVVDSYDAIKAETRSKGKAAAVEMSSGSSNVNMRSGKGKEKSPYDVEDAWRAVVAMSPQLRPVDERADDFISKVREDLKIESQRSIVEFQDMLKRSV